MVVLVSSQLPNEDESLGCFLSSILLFSSGNDPKHSPSSHSLSAQPLFPDACQAHHFSCHSSKCLLSSHLASHCFWMLAELTTSLAMVLLNACQAHAFPCCADMFLDACCAHCFSCCGFAECMPSSHPPCCVAIVSKCLLGSPLLLPEFQMLALAGHHFWVLAEPTASLTTVLPNVC